MLQLCFQINICVCFLYTRNTHTHSFGLSSLESYFQSSRSHHSWIVLGCPSSDFARCQTLTEWNKMFAITSYANWKRDIFFTQWFCTHDVTKFFGFLFIVLNISYFSLTCKFIFFFCIKSNLIIGIIRSGDYMWWGNMHGWCIYELACTAVLNKYSTSPQGMLEVAAVWSK